jgi:NAD(P)-dependent dehydrogenase (short-subunit alcohol dehydrogenase family)
MKREVLILGGSGGVGSALAEYLSSAGTPVHLMARNRDRLESVASGLEHARVSTVDVLDPQSMKEVVGRAADAADGIGGLAYCIGSIALKPLKAARENDFLDAFRLNALGAVIAVQAAEQGLRRGNGSVVLFSTIAAGSGFPNHAVIAAAKGATESLSRSLAADLAPEVRVNCVAPSLLQTPLAERFTSNEATAQAIARMHPLPRLGEPKDAAAVAAFLLSPDSGWITGQVIPVDGGRSTVRVKG